MFIIRKEFLNKWKKYLEIDKWDSFGGEGFRVWGHGNFPFVASLVPQEANKVLEIGCADGYLLHLLEESGHETIGLTYSTGEQQECLKHGLKAIVADMHDLPFDDNIFDAIVSRQTFEHSLSPLIVLYECNRVLKSMGYMVVHIPYSIDGTDYPNDYHHHPFSPTQWKFYFHKSGFRKILKEGSDVEQNSYYFVLQKTEQLKWGKDVTKI
jgi:ubiquinone/menaquinone biosynthesis C-methylase UbiE